MKRKISNATVRWYGGAGEAREEFGGPNEKVQLSWDSRIENSSP